MNAIYVNTISAEDYCRLRKSVGFYDIPMTLVQKALEKTDYIIAALVDGAAVGMGRLISDGTQILIMDLVVHPDYQAQGIGKGLMTHIREYIESLEYDRMIVNLLTDSSKVEFYRKLGFEEAEGMRLWLQHN